MNILEELALWMRDPMFKWAFPIVVGALYVLFLIGRGIIRLMFSSNGKSFSHEVEENNNQPMGGSESIGSISIRLGDDVRDVWEKGYSDEQINGVLTSKYTLEEMYKMPPVGKR